MQWRQEPQQTGLQHENRLNWATKKETLWKDSTIKTNHYSHQKQSLEHEWSFFPRVELDAFLQSLPSFEHGSRFQHRSKFAQVRISTARLHQHLYTRNLQENGCMWMEQLNFLRRKPTLEKIHLAPPWKPSSAAHLQKRPRQLQTLTQMVQCKHLGNTRGN